MIVEENEESTTEIGILPDELLISIFKWLPLETILKCENVCSHWKKLARDAAIWRQFVLVYSGKPGQSEVSRKNLDIIKSHQDCICHLKIQYIYDYPKIKSIIQPCQNLISLELVMCLIVSGYVEDIKQWPKLKKISLKNSLVITAKDLSIDYNNFKYLQHLTLADFGLPVLTRDTLLGCNYLSHIHIEKIKNLDITYIHSLIKSKMEILQTLHIYGADGVNDESLNLLSQCKLLKDIGIIRCENLTDVGLLHLPKLNVLERLQLWNNQNFSEVNLHRVLRSSSLVKLKRLSFSRVTNISPLIVDVISECYTNLRFLAVYQCPRIINTDYKKQLNYKLRNIDVVLY